MRKTKRYLRIWDKKTLKQALESELDQCQWEMKTLEDACPVVPYERLVEVTFSIRKVTKKELANAQKKFLAKERKKQP